MWCWLLIVLPTLARLCLASVTLPDYAFPDFSRLNISTDSRHRIEQNLMLFAAELSAHFESSVSRFTSLRSTYLGPKDNGSGRDEIAKASRHRSTSDKNENVNVVFLRTLPNVTLKILRKLSDDEYLGKDFDGQLLRLSTQGIEKVTVSNAWTWSTSSCGCPQFKGKDCACCSDGGCLCAENTHMCVECGRELDCFNQSSITDIVSFRFEEILDGTNRLVLMVSDRSLIFAYDLGRTFKVTKDSSGQNQLHFPNQISSLAYEEIFVYDRSLRKRRILFIFFKLEALHKVFEVVRSPNSVFYLRELYTWTTKGEDFQSVKIKGRVFLGYIYSQELCLDEVKIGLNSATVKKFQRFPASKIYTWQVFKIRREVYLLTRIHDFVQTYIFTGDGFEFHQIFGPISSTSTLLVDGKRETLWILSSQELLSYQLDSDSNWSILQKTPGDFENGTLISLKEVPHLILNSKTAVEIAEVKLEASKTNDGIRKTSKYISEEFQSLMQSMNRAKEKLGAFSSVYDTRITKSEIYKEKILTRKMDLLLNNASIHSLKQAAKSVLKNMQITAAACERTEAFLKDVVPKNGTNKLVRGIKHFYGPHTFVKELRVKYASIGGRSEGRLDTTLQNLVRRDDDETPIHGKKVFRGTVSVKDLRTSTLNGEDTANFITTKKAVTIKGAKYANGLAVHNNVILGENSRVDGIDLSQEVVQQNGFFEFSSCNFKQLNIWGGIVVEDLVNGHSFRQFTDSIFPSEGDVKIPNDAIFKLLVSKNDLEAKMLMGVDSSLFFSEPLLKSADEYVVKAYFSSLQCRDFKAQKINNENFPRDFVVRSGSWIDFGTKSTPKIHFRDLTVRGLIDSLKTQDLVTRSGVQDVSGKKVFTRGIEVMGDLNVVSKRVDGIDLAMFNANITNRQKIIIFNNTVKVPNLLVNGRVNNFVFNEVVDDLIYDNEDLAHCSARKIFLRDLVVKEGVRSISLNEYDPNTLVNTKRPVNISGKKVFARNLTIGSLNVRGLIDKTNISELFRNSLSLGKPSQVVTGLKYFETLIVDNLRIISLLNSRSFDNLLTKSTDQEISQIIYLNETVIKQIDTRSTTAAFDSIVNGIKLKSWKKGLQKNLLDSHLIVEGDVLINKPLEVEWINGHFVENLKNFLRKSQTLISNRIEFNELEVTASVFTNSTFGNAANLKPTVDSALHLINNNYWSGASEWQELQVDEIEVVNLVNERDLREMDLDAVYLQDYRRFFLRGKKTFENGFYVKGDLDARINGLNLRNLFSRTTPQRINSTFYLSHFTVPSISLKKFNGINLKELKIAQRRKNIVIDDSLVFGGHVNVSHLQVHDHLENIRMDEIFKDSIRLDQEALIAGKAFKEMPLFEEVKIGKINGQYLFVEKMRGQRSFSSLTIGGTLAIELLKTSKFITKNKTSLLYGNNLRRNFALVGEEISKLTFRTISIKGETYSNTVNGYKMRDFLTKTTKQEFPSHVSIKSIQTKNVSVSTINGFKIQGKLMKGEITIALPSCTALNLSIGGDLNVTGVFGLKKIEIPDHLILLHGHNSLLGSVYFTKKLVTSRLQSTNNINGMKFGFLKKNIEDYRNFFKENFLAEFKRNQYDYITAMETIFYKECEKTGFLEAVARNCPIKEHSFNLVSSQSLDGEGLKDNEFTPPILIFELASAVWIMNSLNSCTTEVSKWNENLKIFDVMYSLPTSDVGDVVQWIIVQSTQDSIHILGVSPKGRKCGSIGSSLWVAKYPSYHLQFVQKVSEASKAFVNSNLVYLNVGSELLRYEFQNGALSNKVSLRPSLKVLRSHPLGNGRRLVISVWEDDYLEIEDTSHQFPRLTYMQGVRDVIILNHLDEVFVLVSRTRNTNAFSWYYEIFSYRNLSLFPMMDMQMDGPSQLKPLRIKDSLSTNATFLLNLVQSAAPKVLKMEGQTFVKTWSEFPLKLKRSPWAFDFRDNDGVYHLVFGDEDSLYTTYLEMKGKKYEKDGFTCRNPLYDL